MHDVHVGALVKSRILCARRNTHASTNDLLLVLENITDKIVKPYASTQQVWVCVYPDATYARYYLQDDELLVVVPCEQRGKNENDEVGDF